MTAMTALMFTLGNIQSVDASIDDYKFDSNFGSTGNGDGQFDIHRGVAVDSNDRIIVADKSNYRIQIFAKPTFCHGLNADQLLSSGKYSSIFDNRDGSHGTTITGTNGKDLIIASENGDTIYGGSGYDITHAGMIKTGKVRDDIVYGGVGRDIIYGGKGDDIIDGDAGNDNCDGGPGDNTITNCEN